MIKAKLFGFLSLVFALAFGQGALAQDSTNQVAVKSDWSVFADSGPKQCWGVSQPLKTVNTKDGKAVTVRRGDIRLFVTFTPGNGGAGVVSFAGGYTFDDKTKVVVDVEGKTFDMAVENDWAWASPEVDAVILTAMKKGALATVTGLSNKGTSTQDTFSLKGFTAAMEEAEARCK